MRTYNSILTDTAQGYMDSLDKNNLPPAAQIEENILDLTMVAIDLANQFRDHKHKLKARTTLTPIQIAIVLNSLYHICVLDASKKDKIEGEELLVIYQPEGKYRGIYISDESIFRKLVLQFNPSYTETEFVQVMKKLRSIVPKKKLGEERNLIAVNNGIFDYESKTLLPFDPEHVFVSKSMVDYNPNARNIVIHNDQDNTDWDVESWMKELSDDPDVITLLWQIIGAIIRPNIPWGKCALFYSESGNNGKGTLCELMRNICGDGSYTSLPIADFAKPFQLEPIIGTSAIITDENDVGTYIDSAGYFKAVITSDPININRKNRIPISYRFHGFMVQCLNALPKLKDKSESMYRRLILVPFERCFSGAERKYIKNDYLHRKEVLEYVLYKVLNMNYNELIEPDVCKKALNMFKDEINPIRTFWLEFKDRFVWDLLPYGFLYDLYKSWSQNEMGKGQNYKSKNAFLKELRTLIKAEYSNIWVDHPGAIAPMDRMDKAEELIKEYDLVNWKNHSHFLDDTERMCHPPLKSTYKGFLRI